MASGKAFRVALAVEPLMLRDALCRVLTANDIEVVVLEGSDGDCETLDGVAVAIRSSAREVAVDESRVITLAGAVSTDESPSDSARASEGLSDLDDVLAAVNRVRAGDE